MCKLFHENQVFNKAATWHGKMKDLAKNLILEPKVYRAMLQPDGEFDTGGYNSQDYEDVVTRNVKALLKDWAYLQNTKKDSEVH